LEFRFFACKYLNASKKKDITLKTNTTPTIFINRYTVLMICSMLGIIAGQIIYELSQVMNVGGMGLRNIGIISLLIISVILVFFINKK